MNRFLRVFWRVGAFFSFAILMLLTYVYFLGISRQTAIEWIPDPIRNSINFIRDVPYLPYVFKTTDLPRCQLTISDDNYQKILNALPKKVGEILLDSQRNMLPATLTCDGKEMNVQAGVRGDRFWHWLFEKKSWGFKFAGLYDGNSEVKFIIADDRGYIGEYFNGYRARKMGLPAPDDKLVLLSINHGPDSFYYQVEGWTEEFLKKHFGTDRGNLYGESGFTDPIFDSTLYWKKYVTIPRKDNDYGDLYTLLSLIENSDDATFKKEIWNIVDRDNFFKWQIHSILSGSTHQGPNHNVRLFFDAQKRKFFPIPWDVGITDYSSLFSDPNVGEIYGIDVSYNSLVSRILSIPEFLAERNEKLWAYVADDRNLNEDLAFFDGTFEKVKPAIFNDSIKFWRNYVADKRIKDERAMLISNYRFLRKRLDSGEVFADVVVRSDSNIVATIDLAYKSVAPLNFDGFSISSPVLQPANFRLYEDSNGSGALDQGDAAIGIPTFRDNRIASEKMNYPLYSRRTEKDSLAPIVVGQTKKRFFVVASTRMSATDGIATVRILNMITKKIIEPAIHTNEHTTEF